MEYITPDSVAPLSRDEIKKFADYMNEAAISITPVYTQLSIDALSYNAAGDTATFTAHTTFNDGLSYTEKGQLYKNAKGKWKLDLTDDSYTISNKDKYTKELLRNLSHGLDQVLASRSIPQYQLRLADAYYTGVMESKNLKHFFTIIENVANTGNLDAKRRLALAYLYGDGVEKDYDKFFNLIKEAAEAGDSKSMYCLGWAYHEGQGTVKDYGEALKWYQKAMDAGDTDAIGNIGYMFKNGQGVPKDEKKGFEYYMRAADLGDEVMIYNVGRCYQFGTGVEKDIKKAEEWYKKAIDGGYDVAIVQLGDLYYFDTKEYDKAFYNYKKAAEKGNYRGMFMTGECYEKGRGTDRDLYSAATWYDKARDKKYPGADQAFSRINGWDYLRR